MQIHEGKYQAATSAAAFYRLENAGYLSVFGEDRSAFLQRQTTNDINQLRNDHALLSVLTSPAARILDVFYLLQQDNGIGIITLPGNAESTYRFLKSRIFFMDKVQVDNVSDQLHQVEIFGPQAGEILQGMVPVSLPDTGEVRETSLDGLEARLLKMDGAIGLGFRLIIAAETSPAAWLKLCGAGMTEIDETTYRVLKIEGGIRSAGMELNETYTPLETGLESAISTTKGCYTGQEVIARQITYDKVTQHLCGIRLGRQPALNAHLWDGDRPAGEITSWVISPRFGIIGLAMIKNPSIQTRKTLETLDENGEKIPVEITSLPFRK